MVKTYGELYMDARRELMTKEDPQSAGLIARELICHISGKTQEQVIAHRDTYASEDICRRMEEAVPRVLAEEPLAYILGEWDFYGMTLHVDKNVLIPRDDTCAVTALAINQAMFLDESPRILDLCTGTGCIGLAIARRVKDAKVTLADISREALAVAKKNITALKLSGRVACMQVDALGEPNAFLGKYDLIVSNPPYITTQEMLELPESVKNYEPHLALHGGTDGLEFYRAIAKNFRKALKPGGYLCFEFGMGQGDDVCTILEENGYIVLERSRDYNDRERAVIARLRKDEQYGN